MKQQLIALLIVMSSIPVYGQHDFGIKFNAGLSKIANSFDPSNASISVQFAPSSHGGFFYNINLGNRSVIGTELLVMQIAGKETSRTDLVDRDGRKVGQSNNEVDKHVSYLSLPIYYGFKFKGFMVSLGIQSSLHLASGGREKGHAILYGDTVTWDKTVDKLNIDGFDIGLRGGVAYNLTERIALEATYYHGVNDILRSNIPLWTWRVRQATIGVRYHLQTLHRWKRER